MVASVDLEATWGNRKLPFRLRRADVKRLRIAVDPEGRIAVTAPRHATDEEVVARVSRRGDWIQRQQQSFALWHPRTPVRQYLGGETHLFLGEQLRLQVEADLPESVERHGNRLMVGLGKVKGRHAVRKLVQEWYAVQARLILRERWSLQRKFWAMQGAEASRVIVRPLRNRWGSMTPAGSLVLNAQLVHAELRLIDYVIAHELAHARFPDHGPEWKRLMSRAMPDWVIRKHQLENQLL